MPASLLAARLSFNEWVNAHYDRMVSFSIDEPGQRGLGRELLPIPALLDVRDRNPVFEDNGGRYRRTAVLYSRRSNHAVERCAGDREWLSVLRSKAPLVLFAFDLDTHHS
jgi:hypothetical protein